MSAELALVQETTVLPSLLMTYNDMERMADKLATSSLKELRDNPGDAFIYLLIVRETGMSLPEVVNNFYLVDGKIAAYGQYMLSQVLRAGHKVRFREEGTPRTDEYRMTCTIIRADDPGDEFSVTWSIKRAKESGLYDPGKKTSAWFKWTPSMLRWRAFTEAARFKVPDAMGFAKYTPEELGADVNEEGIPVHTITSAKPPRTSPAQEVAPKPVVATVTRLDTPKKSTPSPEETPAAPTAEPKTVTVVTPSKAPTPPAAGGREAQEIYSDALNLVKTADREKKLSDPGVRKSFNQLKLEMDRARLAMSQVVVPASGPGDTEKKRPLRGALAVLEKHLG